MQTLNELLKWATDELRPVVGDRALFEARLLLSHVTGLSPVELISLSPEVTAEAEVKKWHRSLEKLIRRRQMFEPVAYLLGVKEFYGDEFLVGPGVLIPRPETEALVEWVVKLAKLSKSPSLKILDLCAGSGAIAISLVKQTSAKVTALEYSPHALSYLRENVARLCSPLDQKRIDVVEADLFAGPRALFQELTKSSGVDWDIIVSNPPYIPTEDLKSLAPDIQNFEPMDALDGGHEGLRFYEAIARLWWPMTRQALFLEAYDEAQRTQIRALFPESDVEESGPHLMIKRSSG